MDRLIYTALSGQTAIDSRLRQITNELANVSTTGFKRSLTAAMQTYRYDGPGFQSRYVSGALSPNTVDMTPGSIQSTGRTLDISLGDMQLLVVRAKDGSVGYTRRGDLSLAEDGTLKIGSGEQVLNESGTPIAIPPLSEVKIGTDGTVLIIPDGDQLRQFVPLDRLQVVQAQPDQVVLREDGLYRPADDTVFETATLPKVNSGSLEGSNANVFSALIDMISMSRRYEMQVKVLKQADDLAQRSQSQAQIRM
jgi:flagellar basal-body rod protein FlgF